MPTGQTDYRGMIGPSILDLSAEETCEDLRQLSAKWGETHVPDIPLPVRPTTRNDRSADVVRTLRSGYKGDGMAGGDPVDTGRRVQDLYNAGARDCYEVSDEPGRSVDSMDITVYCNQISLDYKKDEAVRINPCEYTAPRNRDGLYANMGNRMTGHTCASRIWVRSEDGSEFPASLGATCETDNCGENALDQQTGKGYDVP